MTNIYTMQTNLSALFILLNLLSSSCCQNLPCTHSQGRVPRIITGLRRLIHLNFAFLNAVKNTIYHRAVLTVVEQFIFLCYLDLIKSNNEVYLGQYVMEISHYHRICARGVEIQSCSGRTARDRRRRCLLCQPLAAGVATTVLTPS